MPSTRIDIVTPDGTTVPINEGYVIQNMTVGEIKQRILNYINANKTLPALTASDITFNVTSRGGGYVDPELLDNDEDDIPFPDEYDDSNIGIEATFPAAPAVVVGAAAAAPNGANPLRRGGGRSRRRSTRRRQKH